MDTNALLLRIIRLDSISPEISSPRIHFLEHDLRPILT